MLMLFSSYFNNCAFLESPATWSNNNKTVIKLPKLKVLRNFTGNFEKSDSSLALLYDEIDVALTAKVGAVIRTFWIFTHVVTYWVSHVVIPFGVSHGLLGPGGSTLGPVMCSMVMTFAPISRRALASRLEITGNPWPRDGQSEREGKVFLRVRARALHVPFEGQSVPCLQRRLQSERTNFSALSGHAHVFRGVIWARRYAYRACWLKVPCVFVLKPL